MFLVKYNGIPVLLDKQFKNESVILIKKIDI